MQVDWNGSGEYFYPFCGFVAETTVMSQGYGLGSSLQMPVGLSDFGMYPPKAMSAFKVHG